MNFLLDFIVSKEGGKVIYSTDSKLDIVKDVLLFGGFLEAINNCYNHALIDNLKKIEGCHYRISFMVKKDFQFIGLSSTETDPIFVKMEFEYYAYKFTKLFQNKLSNISENDVRVFKKFNNEILKSESVEQYATS
ncbi:MAG: hypothetical protein ACFFD5_01565 [Candidatus Thorarchaeota archaeon]